MANLDYQTFAEELTRWFQTAQRDLPWRHENNARDAYRVLVSEVMLQQTTVAAVVPFYHRFLARFPNIQTLAEAELDEVLPLWAGLGYYSRARNLHACVRAVVEKHGGEFPQTFGEILALPGIGRYTAGAVLSIAHDQKIPIVDANVARVLARVLCLEGDIKNSDNQTQLWNQAEQLVQAAKSPSQFNPAMMELGALICVPKNPRCETCPVSSFCCAFGSHRQNELPHATPKRKEIEMHDVCAFVIRDNKVLLRRRSDEKADKNWWRGMWELPRVTKLEGETTTGALNRLFSMHSDTQIEVGRILKTVSHGVTHHRITLECVSVGVEEISVRDDWRSFEWAEIEALALPSVMRSLLRWLQDNIVQNEQLALL